jgi:Tfp pilus assembly protein PilF/CheY-like chemotaxis protein
MIASNKKVAIIFPQMSDVLDDFGLNRQSHFNNSLKAYERLIRDQHDLIILDLNMPTMSGSVLLQKLRGTGNYGLETIIFVAEHVDEQTFQLFTEYDVNYVLLRPIDHKNIQEKIQYAINTEKQLPILEQRYREAKAAYFAGMPEIARSCVMQIIRKKMGKLEKPYILLGDIEFQQNDYFSARVAYEKALSFNPESVAAHYKLAKTYMAEKNFNRSSEILDKLAEKNQGHIDLLVNAGLSSFNRGDLKQAKKHMTSVKKLDESNKTSSEIIVNIAIEEGDYEIVSETLMTSHNLKELVSYLNNTGVRLSKEGRYGEAIELFINCMNSVEGSEYEHTVVYNLALACIKNGAKNNGQKYLLKSLTLNPGFKKAAVTLQKHFPHVYQEYMAKLKASA